MFDYAQISSFLLHNEKHPSVSPLKGRIATIPRGDYRGVFLTEINTARFLLGRH